MSNYDPTHAEMEDFLYHNWDPKEITQFDVEEAIYWFAHDHHGGQTSNLYSVLSTSKFKPGAYNTGLPDDSISLDMYTRLVEEFT